MARVVMTRDKMAEVKRVVDTLTEPASYAEIAEQVSVEKKYVNKTLLERIYGYDNVPSDKIRLGRVGIVMRNPVYSAKGTITISSRILEGAGIEVGERFEVVVSSPRDRKTITLKSQGIDESYLSMLETRRG